MTNKELLQYCNEYLSYDADSGVLRWIKKGAVNTAIGSEAGYMHHTGYRYINLRDKAQASHRLIFLMVNGYLPEFVDHIDRDRDNNKLNNLREVTRRENSMNRGPIRNGTSNYKGVSWIENKKKWHSQIKHKGKVKNLGRFKCEHEAARAYNLAARMYHGVFAYTNLVSES